MSTPVDGTNSQGKYTPGIKRKKFNSPINKPEIALQPTPHKVTASQSTPRAPQAPTDNTQKNGQRTFGDSSLKLTISDQRVVTPPTKSSSASRTYPPSTSGVTKSTPSESLETFRCTINQKTAIWRYVGNIKTLSNSPNPKDPSANFEAIHYNIKELENVMVAIGLMKLNIGP